MSSRKGRAKQRGKQPGGARQGPVPAPGPARDPYRRPGGRVSPADEEAEREEEALFGRYGSGIARELIEPPPDGELQTGWGHLEPLHRPLPPPPPSVTTFLPRAQFPASRQDLVDAAREASLPDAGLDWLAALPERRFATPDEVTALAEAG